MSANIRIDKYIVYIYTMKLYILYTQVNKLQLCSNMAGLCKHNVEKKVSQK